MITKIVRGLTEIRDKESTSEQVLSWARGVEVQRAQKVILGAAKESIEFDAVKKHEQQNNATGITKASNC